ncbi:endogenous retrovirus group K member 24 Gag polyproteinpolyprotein-like isoform X1 [Podarcis lilfordi]|uniref:Endogenous retrovirus group K member 24 Gag polyproteinpolyprotein-like isoform X1 n=1 Tax=Podarcis lilfordi TaxID=74358 RepID=A0AA35K0V8_9SAUR|nr:endogenous retrovirus group K member 24 Gag polyproteinpolyprotein-like isoform X1 [Podarcis lilfordi]
MGSSLSAPQQKFLKDLKFLLSSNKLEVPDGDLIQLILTIGEHSPWFPADGTWELKLWDKIGEHFHGHPSISVRILNAWCKVRYAMDSLSPKNISMAALPTQPSASLIQPAVLETVPILALPDPKPPDPKPPDYSSSPEDPILQKYHGLAGNDPNLSVAEPATPFQRAVLGWTCSPSLIQDTMAFPVIVPPAGAPAGTQAQHQPFDFKILKELQQSVKANGLQASYTQAPLEATLAQLLVPEAHTVLPPSAGVLFAHEWETACRAYAPALLQQVRGNNPNVTLADVLDAMLGRGPFAQASVQATLLQILLRDTALAAKQAMRKIPEPTSIQSRWGSIRQEARESYSSFMDRLLTAVSRQIENPEAKQIIIKQLAFENANEDCKLALRPIIHNPATDTAAMLRICQSVVTATHKAHLLATALNENQPVATDTTYFQGGKPGSPIPQGG